MIIKLKKPIKTNKTNYEINSFNKNELNLILRIYSRMVSLGEWKDYSIFNNIHFSEFSIYRNSSEHPLYIVKKNTRKNIKRDVFSIISFGGTILKSGNNLELVLKFFEKRNLKILK